MTARQNHLETEDEMSGKVPSKKRGRPRKNPVGEAIPKEETAPKKRGRPPKNGWTKTEDAEDEAFNAAWEKAARALLDGASVSEAAKAANVSRYMVYRYLKDERFNRYLDGLVDREVRLCEASIWNTLKEMCMGGDLSAIKLYFELRGRREKPLEESSGAVVQIIDDVPDLSPEELKKIYGPLAGEELEKEDGIG